MEHFPAGTAVKIDWVDSAATHGWVALEPNSHPAQRIKSIGYVLEDTDAHITISTSQDDMTQARGLCPVTIPKCAIKMIERLEEATEYELSRRDEN